MIRRPGATIDAQRLGRAVSYPGIDPRNWVSLAVVSRVYVDPTHGPIVDVVLLPSGIHASARVGAEGASGGAGVWWPIAPDDEVILIAPDGEPAHGLVVARRLWSQPDPPPQVVVDNPGDPLVLAPPGTTLRLLSDAKVELGAAGAAQSAVRGEAWQSDLKDFLEALKTYVNDIAGIADPSSTATPPFLAKLELFEAQSDYLSDSVKVP